MVQAPQWRVERVEVPAHDAVVYRVDGVLGDGPACWRFLEDVRQDVQAGPRLLVLNLRGVPHATSPGIGILAACFTSAKKASKRVVLTSVSRGVAEVLAVAGLAETFPTYPTEDAALEAA
jgi:anti-anti-sigma factor